MKRAVFVVLLVMIAGEQGYGDTYLQDGGTHNIDYEVSDNIVVDFQAPGMQTTVNLYDGALMLYALLGYNDSRLNVTGGLVMGIDAHDRTQVTMSRGSVCDISAFNDSLVEVTEDAYIGNVYAYDCSRVFMSSSVSSSWLYTYGSSQVTVSSGQLYDLYMRENSRVAITGGSHELCFARIYDSSVVTISSGSFAGMDLRDNSRAVISGGQFQRIDAWGSSRVELSGGSVNVYPLAAHDTTQVEISGGRVSQLTIADSSRATISGGSVGSIIATEGSQIIITGGSVGYSGLGAEDTSQVVMSGGSAFDINVSGDASFTMSDGSTDYLSLRGNAKAMMSGGEILTLLGLSDYAELTIAGSCFNVDGIPIGPGEIISISGDSGSKEPLRWLGGRLANGDILRTYFTVEDSASIIIIPEPATLSLLALGSLALRIGHRRRRYV